MCIQVSIIIVNYNVKAFLEQCLYSVFKSIENIKSEIFVVDNNSIDDSVEMLRTSFPQVKLIENSENKGFAFACNQGIKLSTGKYILLLNPDTVIHENSLKLCFDFMEENSDAGALGVKMIDGKGNFLPESKRSLPTASSAFYKMFGLAALFPESKTFGKYQLRYLDPDKIHEVEVLSGAFMFIRKDVLEQTGLLDEDFFMYGEDIDLSHRIRKAGFKNYYFPLTTIIHYKGESTKKSSVRYVRMFYNAMLIFSNKHYKGKYLSFFHFLIHLAIYFRAGISVINRIMKFIFLPILDFALIYLVYATAVNFWEFYKFSSYHIYSKSLTNIYLPIYIVIWLIFVKYFKGYRAETKIWQLLKAVLAGTTLILAIYSLLPENYRYSRALILIGAIICFISLFIIRMVYRLIINNGKIRPVNKKKATLIIGNFNDDSIRVLLKKHEATYDIKKIIGNIEEPFKTMKSKLQTIVDILKIDTIIFIQRDIPASEIINSFILLNKRNIEFKIILPVSSSLVGSQSVLDLNLIPQFRLNPVVKIENKLKKRILDMLVSFLFLLFAPVLFIWNKPSILFSLIFKVLKGGISWVSYSDISAEAKEKLPYLKPGIFDPTILLNEVQPKKEDVFEINFEYAKNYQLMTDLIIIFKALKKTIRFKKSIKYK